MYLLHTEIIVGSSPTITTTINNSMKYTVIEDCSPYYIRFTYEGINEVINYCKLHTPDIQNSDSFVNYTFPKEHADHLLSIIPMAKQMPLRPHRVSLFMTKEGMYYRAHKDGIADRFSINYTVQVLDDKCVTSWYSDEDLKNYQLDPELIINRRSRECVNFVKENHAPLKSMVAKPGECILFNSEIFHDFDNSQSTALRTVLTLRIMDNLQENTYFEDAKNILFGDDII